MARTRIPETISRFDSYINNTDDYLQAIASGTTHNWERLGLSNTNADDWLSKRTHWRDTLYPKYINPQLSSATVKAQVANFMSEFRFFANPLLNRMASSPAANSNDEAAFNFVITRAAASHHTVAIAETLSFSVSYMGGAELRFSCRVASHSGRAAKAKGADSVQVAFKLINNRNEALPPLTEMQRELFTKAVFIMPLGAENIGKAVALCMRWYNTKHPSLAGPWTDRQVFVIP